MPGCSQQRQVHAGTPTLLPVAKGMVVGFGRGGGGGVLVWMMLKNEVERGGEWGRFSRGRDIPWGFGMQRRQALVAEGKMQGGCVCLGGMWGEIKRRAALAAAGCSSILCMYAQTTDHRTCELPHLPCIAFCPPV